MDTNRYIVLQNMKPKSRPSLQVVKEAENGQFHVFKIYGSQLKQETYPDVIKRVSKWRHLRSKYLQQCSPLPTNDEEEKFQLTMDYMPRGSIKRQMKHGSLTYEQRMKIAFYAANAIFSLHVNGFVHGNLCPSNVLLDSNLEPKVTDFLPDLSMKCKHQTYVATEIISNQISQPNEQTDIYSYGKVLRFLFDSEIKENNTKLPQAFSELINKCTSEKPENRPSAEDIVELFIRNAAFIKLNPEKSQVFTPLLEYKEYLHRLKEAQVQEHVPEQKPTEEQPQQTEEQKPEEQKPTEEQQQQTDEQKPEEQQQTEEQKPEEQKPTEEQQQQTDEQKPKEQQKPEEQQQKPEEQQQEESDDDNYQFDYTIDIDTLTDDKIMYRYAYHFYTDFEEYHSFSKALTLLQKCSPSLSCASYGLAILLSEGNVVQQDIVKSADLFRSVSDTVPEANLALGKMLVINLVGEKEENECLTCLQKAADKGLAEAQFVIGNCYQYGLGHCQKDLEQAAYHYHLAAMKGHIEAQLLYGTLLRSGYGVNKNIEEAATIYKAAAEKGDASAMTQYAMLLRNGVGVKKDVRQAANFLRTAADKEFPEAQNSYGVMLKNGEGVAKNVRLSAQYIQKAADAGNVPAQNNLGWMLKTGCGVSKNVEQSAKYYKIAAEAGSAVGQNNYGLALLNGLGVQKSEKQAAVQFHKSADQDDEFGLLNYGMALLDGIGTKQNYQDAASQFKKAADKGNSTAQFQYARMLKDGVGIEKDYPEAAKYFKLAGDQGNQDARFQYGTLLKNGIGIPKDEEEAEKYLKIVTTHGSNRFFSIGGAKGGRMSESDGTSSGSGPNTFSSDAGNNGLNLNLNEMMNKLDLGIDDKEALKFIKMAADQGNVSAMIQYAKMCGNEEEELKYLQMAADLGSVEAQLSLGLKNFKKDNEEEEEISADEEIAPELELPQSVPDLEESPDSDAVEDFAAPGDVESREINFDELVAKEVKPDPRRIKFGKSDGQLLEGELSEDNFHQSRRRRPSTETSQDRINLRSIEAINLFRQSSDLGDPEGHYQLGLCYEKGLGLPEDLQKAQEEFKEAADIGHTKAAYRYASLQQQEGHDDEALKYYLQAAKDNHTKSKLQAALMLEKDIANFESLMQAATYFRELSVIGYAEAMYHYAVMLRDGLGMPIDYPRSAHYFLRAAQLDYLDSGLQYGLLLIGDKKIEFMITQVKKYFLMAIRENQTDFGYFLLGLFMVTGIGLSRDIPRAITALQMCAERNERAATIIQMCQERNNDVRFVALQSLADAGCIEAMHKIALIYKREKDAANFIKYIKKAADNDFMPSQFEYGAAEFTGYGCEKNLRDGTNRVTKAADNNIVDAMFYIAKERERGVNIEKDIDEAVRYYQMAIAKDSAKAMFRYGMLHILRIIPNANPLEGVSYIIKAMQVNEEETAIEYATMLHEGDLVDVDDERAKGLLQTYADKGSKAAINKYIEFYGEYRPLNGDGIPLYTMKSSSELIFSFLLPKATESQSILTTGTTTDEEKKPSDADSVQYSISSGEEDVYAMSTKARAGDAEHDSSENAEENVADNVADNAEEGKGSSSSSSDDEDHEDLHVNISLSKNDEDLTNQGNSSEETETEVHTSDESPLTSPRNRKIVIDPTALGHSGKGRHLSRMQNDSDYSDQSSGDSSPRTPKRKRKHSSNGDGDSDGEEKSISLSELRDIPSPAAHFLAEMNDYGQPLDTPLSPSLKNSFYRQPSVIDFLAGQTEEARNNAAKGNSDDQLKLALILLKTADPNANNNYQEAMENLKRSADNENTFSVYLYDLFKDKENELDVTMEHANRHFKALANKDNVPSMFIYGFMLRIGFGCEQDLEQCVQWFKKAAKGGHADAQYNAGLMIRHGIGHKQDPRQAATYYRMAADQRHTAAAFNLAILYQNGWGVKQNARSAAHFFQIAAEGGDPEAEANFGLIMKNGIGVAPNMKIAVKYFRRSARQGNPVGQNNYALILSHGWENHPPNPVKAANFFKFSADQGNLIAMYNYAQAQLNGLGTKQKPLEGAKLMLEAAEKGNPDAQLKIGQMLRLGDHIEKDVEKGIKFIVRSAKQGNTNAMVVLGRLLKNGDGTQQNPELAAKYFSRAANLGNDIAQLNYGLLLKDGNGVEQNKKLAADYIKTSADSGNMEAQCYYAVMLNEGRIVEKNEDLALKYFEMSAKQGFKAAQKYYNHIMRKRGQEQN